MIVLDASIFAKLLLDEPDRSKAQSLIEHVLAHREGMIAPSLIIYETLSIALRHSVPFDEAMELLGRLRVSGLSIEEPTIDELTRAEQIATAGHSKSGYPALSAAEPLSQPTSGILPRPSNSAMSYSSPTGSRIK